MLFHSQWFRAIVFTIFISNHLLPPLFLWSVSFLIVPIYHYVQIFRLLHVEGKNKDLNNLLCCLANPSLMTILILSFKALLWTSATNKIFRHSQRSRTIACLFFYFQYICLFNLFSFYFTNVLCHFLVFHSLSVTIPNRRDFINFTVSSPCSVFLIVLFVRVLLILRINVCSFQILSFLSWSLSKFVFHRSVWVILKYNIALI